MLSFLRGSHPPRTNNAANNPIYYDKGTSNVRFHQKGSEYIMTHTLPRQGAEDGVSIVQPPFHYHIYQNEFFQLHKGTAVIYKGIDPKPFAILSEDGPRTATIPAGRYHRFENQSSTEELVIDIHLSPEDYENELSFFRNFFGYLDDCKQNKTAPSFFQLMVFLHSADTPLAIPAPYEMLGKVLSRILLTSASFVGSWILGYKTSYPEYYEPKKAI